MNAMTPMKTDNADDVAFDKAEQRMMTGARNYARADRSDPFTLARCLTHIALGIAGPGAADDGKADYYDATEASEKRWVEFGGEDHEYFVPAFRNLQRP